MAKKQFKAESKRLLDLMVNSIYTHKEIFLRELISNASDAMDKLSYQALTDDQIAIDRENFCIRVTADKENRTLTVTDQGIGMSREELENNLGVIASSGSYKFKQEMKDADGVDIIGQFGVGFYSAFMVADHITVTSRRYGEAQAWRWESSGADGYTVTECEKAETGTEIVLHLKEDTETENYSQYLEEHTLVQLIEKYSDYIRYPIRMLRSKSRRKEGSPDDKPEYESYQEEETVNSMVPLWQRKRSEVSDEDYQKFYREKFMDYTAPRRIITVSAEGNVTYKALLFIPANAPYDFYSKDYKAGLQLYSSGVLIMENCADLLPEHFRFVRGVVDSPDLSLNISRELLQHDHQLKLIAANLEKKIRGELEKLLKEDRGSYEEFFKSFGRQLKYGAVADYGANKDKLLPLLLFYSSTEKKPVTLQEYADRMPAEQKYIYYACGDNLAVLDKLPQAERLKEQQREILYFTDEVDEFLAQMIHSFQDKELRSVLDDELDLPEEENAPKEEDKKAVLDFVKETLGDKVQEVRLSKKLKSHPVCLTAGKELSFEMEKYFAALQPEAGLKAQRILELNAGHSAFDALEKAMAEDPEKARRYARLLYDQALLIAGLPLEDPSGYTDLVCGLMN